MILWNELNFWKMSKNTDFFETCFSQVNDVGLSTVYVITKNGLDLFHWELNCFALKVDSIWKSGIMRRTLWFERFLGSWPVKRTCMYTYTHKWLVCMHSWGNWIVLFCFWFIEPNCFKWWIILYELGGKYSLNPFTLKLFHESFVMNK